MIFVRYCVSFKPYMYLHEIIGLCTFNIKDFCIVLMAQLCSGIYPQIIAGKGKGIGIVLQVYVR